MTRISNLGANQRLVTEMLRTQARFFEDQRQVTSGKKATSFKGIPRQAKVLLGAKSIQSRLDQFQRIGVEVSRIMATNDMLLSSLVETAEDLRQKVLNAIATNSAPALADEMRVFFDRAVSVLNTQQGGKFLFGGSRTGRPPVNITTIAELAALPAASDAFDNNSVKLSVKIDETFTLTYGVLADETGQDLLTGIKRLAEFNFGPNGPLGNIMTELQRTFLQGEVGTLNGIITGLNNAVAKNGVNQASLEQVTERLAFTRLFTDTFVADIEDVDIAQALNNMNQDQVALEAAFRMLAQFGRLTLLDFI